MAVPITRTSTQEFVDKYGNEKWKPSKADEQYYSIKAPQDLLSPLTSVFVYPLLESLGLKAPTIDPTYGRWDLPYSPREQRIRNDPSLTIWDARVFLDASGNAVSEKTNRWIYYQVWWNERVAKEKGNEADICFCHGINDYGGKISDNARRFLDAGYRLIVPDLPSHGRSTGLHAFLLSPSELALAVHVCLADVSKRDGELGHKTQRKTVVSGQSMGGFTSILYGLLYHSSKGPQGPETNVMPPNVVGILALCPMLQIAKETRPSYSVELVARTISAVAGRLGFASANRGKSSEDPWAEEEFDLDPQGYHGQLRIATGLSCLAGIVITETHAPDFTLPFRIIHGGADRVTNPKGSQLFYERASTPAHQKEIKIYPGFEHILLRVGRDEDDDRKRQTVLDDMLDWLSRITQ